MLFMSSVVAVSAAVAANKPSLLTIKETLSDTAIVYPESFETDTERLLQNWYIQNYTVLDEDVEDRPSNEATDEEYIKRLAAIPAVIEMPYNQVVRKHIDMYVNNRRTLVEAMLGMSLYYMPIFEQALEQEGLPLELKYLPVVESALDPVAKSRVGAGGLWQFMVATAKGLGLEVNSLVDERMDPYRSSTMAAKYLKQLYSIYNDWSLAIAAYNCGPGKVNQALRRAGGEGKDYWEIYAFLPKETRGYVPAFIAANYVMTYFKYHNISPGLAKKPIVIDTVQVARRVNFNQIAQVLNMSIEELRVLNPQYRRDIIPGDIHPYTLALPSQQIYSYIMSEDSIVGYDAKKYARRLQVEPVTEQYASGGNGDYDYEVKTVTKRHKVRKGETLGKIAKKYGVTINSIKKENRLKNNSLTAGKYLNITTTQRVKVARPVVDDKDDLANEDAVDSVALMAVASHDEAKVERKVTKKNKSTESGKEAKKAKEELAKSTPKKKEAPKSNGTHVVKSGESLYVIAERHGVTVAEIKKANSLSNNKIKPGQKLVIPKKKAEKKASSKNKSSKSKRG